MLRRGGESVAANGCSGCRGCHVATRGLRIEAYVAQDALEEGSIRAPEGGLIRALEGGLIRALEGGRTDALADALHGVALRCARVVCSGGSGGGGVSTSQLEL